MKHFLTVLLCLVTFGLTASGQEAPSDVVVYGATPGGIAAAVAAAREGAAVRLLEPTGHVGGMHTSGLTTAETEHMLAWTLGGISDEFYRRMGAHYRGGPWRDARPAYSFESGVAEQVFLELLREVGVMVRFNAVLKSVEREGLAIRSLILTNGARIPGQVFIDASYEGDLMASVGVAYRVGRERRAEFGEEAAGIRFDTEPRTARTVDPSGDLVAGLSGWRKDVAEGEAHAGVMNYNFRIIVTRDPEKRVPFPKPQQYDPARYALLANWFREGGAEQPGIRLGKIIDLYGRPNGKLAMNNRQAAVISLGHFGGQFAWPEATPDAREAIYTDHKEYSLGLLHFLATDPVVPERIHLEVAELGLHVEEFPDNGHWPYQLYVREGRRMRGAYVMRQQDVQTERRKLDSIGMGSHFIDSHHVQRLAVDADSFINEGRIWRKGWAYQIPYRALVPRSEECTNLLVPVAASFTHVAYCTLRVEGTWMVTGQAAGTAAVLALRNHVSVQQIPVSQLQERLRAQGQVIDFLPGKPELCEKLNGPPEF